MAMDLKHIWISFAITVFFTHQTNGSSDECVYTIYVRTGSVIKAGTDSKISLALYDQYGVGLDIPDLKSWGGLMGPQHSYFERGNMDIFSGRGPCPSGSVCSMKLVSDGWGKHHGWYCNYVEVSTTGPHIQCAQKLFNVEQWLARDAAPYELTVVRNYCPNSQRSINQLDSARIISST